MSEDRVHIDHADSVGSASIVEQTDKVIIPPQLQSADRRHATKGIKWLIGLGLFAMGSSAQTAFWVLTHGLSTLTHQRNEDACYDRYSLQITDGSIRLQVATGKIVSLLIDQTLPQDVRAAQIAPLGIEIGRAAVDVTNAVDARTSWVMMNKPLPCPIKIGDRKP